MHLTHSEYRAFKSRYPTITWPDEEFRVPLEVETPDGRSVWLEYVSGDQFIEAADWLERLRERSRVYDRRKLRKANSTVSRARSRQIDEAA